MNSHPALPPRLPRLSADVEAALLAVAGVAAAHSARLWLVGESALAAELGLPVARVLIALRAESADAAQCAFRLAREELRRTPRRPELRWAGDSGALDAEIAALAASNDAQRFALELERAELGPLAYACDPLAAAWFDPRALRDCVAAGRLPAENDPSDALGWLRACSLSAWSGLECSSTWDASRQVPLASSEPARSLRELHAWAARRGAAAALRRCGERAAEACGLSQPGDETFGVRVDALDALDALDGSPDLGPGLLAAACVLFDPLSLEPAAPELWQEARAALGRCGIDGSLRAAVFNAWRHGAAFERLQQRVAALEFEALRQSERIRIVREPAWPLVARLARAWSRAAPAAPDEAQRVDALVRALDRFGAEFAAHELDPHPLLAIGDLVNARIPRGEPSRELLEEALDLQLDGVLATREAAVSWLHARALDLALGERAQLGGKIRRRKKDSG